jgi:NAD(P)-dependent dehydrogenase (short-subunit alcohol dehydrogenase family)
MNLQLEGKRALVTGSSSGIGAGIAQTLAQEGAWVVVHGRREEAAKQVAAGIERAGGTVAVTLGDLSTDEGARRVAEGALHAFGGIDILVNNAGPFPERGWLEAEAADWLESYNQNVGSVVRITRLLVPGMRERGWGRIVNIGSRTALMAIPTMADYAATKAATLNMTVSLSKELAGTGITVNTVSPGVILTPGAETMFLASARERGWGETWEEIEPRIVREYAPNPSGRIGRVEDMANAVTFVCSPLAGYINGSNLRVDGGTIPTIV